MSSRPGRNRPCACAKSSSVGSGIVSPTAPQPSLEVDDRVGLVEFLLHAVEFALQPHDLVSERVLDRLAATLLRRVRALVALSPPHGEVRRVEPSRRSSAPTEASPADASASSASRTIRSLYSAVNTRRFGRSGRWLAPDRRSAPPGPQALFARAEGGLVLRDRHLQHRDRFPAGPRR